MIATLPDDYETVPVMLRKVAAHYGERFTLAVAIELAYEANAYAAQDIRRFDEMDPEERRRIEASLFYHRLLTTTPDAVHAATIKVVESGDFNTPNKE